MPFVNVDPKLGNQRICNGELSQSVSSNRELANAHDPHTKLGQGKDAVGKLANGNDTPGRHRDTVGSKLEGNMK